MNLLPRPKPLPAPSNDDTLGRGMEMALVTLVFLGLGFGVDAVVGTTPLFTIAFVVFAFAGQFVKLYFTYTHRMKALEADRLQNSRSAARAAAPAPAVAAETRAIPSTPGDPLASNEAIA